MINFVTINLLRKTLHYWLFLFGSYLSPNYSVSYMYDSSVLIIQKSWKTYFKPMKKLCKCTPPWCVHLLTESQWVHLPKRYIQLMQYCWEQYFLCELNLAEPIYSMPVPHSSFHNTTTRNDKHYLMLKKMKPFHEGNVTNYFLKVEVLCSLVYSSGMKYRKLFICCVTHWLFCMFFLLFTTNFCHRFCSLFNFSVDLKDFALVWP
jgi:hypothetical protein